MELVIDIETIPDQRDNAIDLIEEGLTVKAPDMTKPKLIEALSLGPNGKYMTVPELKEAWLERYGNEAKRDQAKEKWLKTSFDGATGEICCICVDIDGDEFTFSSDRKGGGDGDIIDMFWHQIGQKLNGRHATFIAHNAKFDIPFLYHRSVINKIKPCAGFKPHARHGSGIFCTMEAWAGFNNKISLDKLSKALGLEGKAGMSGPDVWPAYERGEHKKIADYCMDDVRLCKSVYKRLIFA